MVHDGHVLHTFMALLSQSDHSIGLKFRQPQYVTTILLKSNDQNLNMNWSMMATCHVAP